MKLDNIKNIKILKQAIYAEQLYCYSILCKLYQELAFLCGPNTTPEQVQNKYSHILSIASYGNVSDYLTSEFSKQESEIIYEYSKYSRII